MNDISAGNNLRNERVCVFILGAADSDRGAIAQALRQLGAALPEELPAPGENARPGLTAQPNATGPTEVDAGMLLGEPGQRQSNDALLEKIRSIIVDQAKYAPLLALYSPEICRSLDAYEAVLTPLDYDARAVIVLGEPSDLAATVNTIQQDGGVQRAIRWLGYNLDAEANTRGLTRHFVRHGNLVQNTKVQIGNIVSSLALDVSIQRTAADTTALSGHDFVVYPRRLNGIDAIADLVPWIAAAQDAFDRLVDNPRDAGAMARLDEVRVSFAAFCERVKSSPADSVDSVLTLTLLNQCFDEIRASQREVALLKERLHRLEARHRPIRRLVRPLVRLRGRAREIYNRVLVARSGLFDRSYYLATYADVRGTRIDPLTHYLRFGAVEERRPSLLFDPQRYIADNPDVAAAGLNPLIHYIQTKRRLVSSTVGKRPSAAMQQFERSLKLLANSGSGDGRPTILILPAIFAVGGVERNTIGIVKELAADYRFILATNERHTSATGCLLPEIAPHVAATIDLTTIGNSDSYLPNLTRVVAAAAPDLVWICNGSIWLHQNMEQLLRLFQNVPIVNQELYDDRHGWINHINASIAEQHDRFIAVNRRIEQRLEAEFDIAGKVDLIYMAIDLNRLPSVRGEPEMRGERNYALVARLTDQKRPLEFIRLAALVAQRRPNVKFHLYGGGPLEEECRSLIAKLGTDNIALHGFVGDVRGVFEEIDGLVFTSDYEGLPSAMLESLGSGVPVFSTDTGDIALIADRFGGCMVVPAGLSAEQMLPAFLEFDANVIGLSDEARKAASQIRETFSTKVLAEQYRLCFQEAWQARADRDLRS